MSPRQSALTIGVLIILSAAVVFVGLLLGTRPMSAATAIRELLHPDGKIDSIFVWTLRLPRSLTAAASGAGLAVSGYILQTLTRNPLADPGITGVTAGAVAPIVCCLVFAPFISPALYPFVGLVGGLSAAAVTFWVSRGGQARPLQLALGGISVSLFLGAITTYVLLLTGPQSASLLFWLTGGFQGRTWSHLFYMLPWCFVGLAGALILRRVIGMLMLSDHAAAAMGLQLSVWKPLLLVLAVIPVAGVAPIAGPVAFVGLASPHIARLLKPQTVGLQIGLSAALGAFIVTIADVIGRSAALPRELPVGIITALIGGPIFIYLVQKGRLDLAGGQ
ncbi:iron ABC transporter permease [Rhizobium sp. P38BS-XIX]|uniref:FecCD family ABC transporter permease n=1 Tax=Rhizobium sp. P38BS-XIX TaxID=2726740 RepID=UPI0014563F58|nr:iron ABC transporter permease [Rhizobium sp. P38BS-XIX]NLS00006.1 iron ABC transporter permease [Rhizobium sp. P38BS-XIX]